VESENLNRVPVRVECHSGYKADEYPECFYLKDERHEIRKILDRWYQSGPEAEWAVSDYFKVETAGGGTFLLKHEIEDDRWYLFG
jgi:hypothetical protein